MSDLFRKAALSRLPAMPPTRAPWADPLEGEEGEEKLDELGSLGTESVVPHTLSLTYTKLPVHRAANKPYRAAPPPALGRWATSPRFPPRSSLRRR